MKLNKFIQGASLVGSLAAVAFTISLAQAPAQPVSSVSANVAMPVAVKADKPEAKVDLPVTSNDQAQQNAKKLSLAEHIALTFNQPLSFVTKVVDTAYQEANRRGLNPLLVLAIVAQESRFDPFALSGAGAKGLMQVLPRYHSDKLSDVGGQKALFTAEANLKVGTAILGDCVNQSNSVEEALRRYSGNARDYSRKVKGYWSQMETVVSSPAAN